MDRNLPVDTPYAILWLRSLAFWFVFGSSIIVFSTLLLFSFPLSLASRWSFISVWVRFILWWLHVTCKLSAEVRGSEYITAEPGIVFSKHQSTWETIALQKYFPQQVWVAKRELMWIPFFGWALALMKTIAIKRGRGRAAVRQLVTQGAQRLKQGLWIVIFPEGTRIPAGQKGRYRIGGAVLSEHTGAAIFPVAHNAGEYWPRRSFIKRPGVIQIRIGKPIHPTGKTAQEILEEASGWIEEQMEQITTFK